MSDENKMVSLVVQGKFLISCAGRCAPVFFGESSLSVGAPSHLRVSDMRVPANFVVLTVSNPFVSFRLKSQTGRGACGWKALA